MKNEIKVESKEGQLIILEGKTLDPKAPININIEANIDSPTRFIEKRVAEFDNKKANVIMNIEDRTIILVINETDPFMTGKVTGKLELSDEFTKFKINTGQSWDCFSLADFIKMNRSFFESKDVAGKLVTTLRNFKAKVDKEIEQSKDDKANYSIKRTQVVNSNLPSDFVLNVRIFKGHKKQSFPVEINIHPDTLNCMLISPDANDFIQEQTEKIIDKEITEIKKLAPEIVVIEQ